MSVSAAPTHVIEISMDDLASLLKRAKELGLPEKDCENLEALIQSYGFLLDEIGDKKASIARLRQLVFGAKTESKANVKRRTGKAPSHDGGEEPRKKPRPKRKGHGRTPAEAYTGTERVKIPHATLVPGDTCGEACCSARDVEMSLRGVLGKDDTLVDSISEDVVAVTRGAASHPRHPRTDANA